MLPGVAIPVAHLHHKDHIFEVICASLDLVTVGRAGFQLPKLCPEVFLQQAFSPKALLGGKSPFESTSEYGIQAKSPLKRTLKHLLT